VTDLSAKQLDLVQFCPRRGRQSQKKRAHPFLLVRPHYVIVIEDGDVRRVPTSRRPGLGLDAQSYINDAVGV
jgi:hypothetical protein